MYKIKICEVCGDRLSSMDPHSKHFKRCDYCGNTEFFYCFESERITPDFDEYMPHIRSNPHFNPQLYQMRMQELRSSGSGSTDSGKPKCPTCGSINIKDISTLNRAVSVGVFGLASSKIGKTKECKNCGYKW